MNRITYAATLLAALAGLHAGCIAAPLSWASFNGFDAGMTKAAAKAAGYGTCAHATDVGDRPTVYCEVPAGKLGLGGLTAKSARLEFKGPRFDRVTEIQVKFDEGVDAVMAALTRVYGPVAGRSGKHTIVWLKDTAQTINMSTRFNGGPTTVRFEFDPDLPARLKAANAKAAAEDAKKKEVLKGF